MKNIMAISFHRSSMFEWIIESLKGDNWHKKSQKIKKFKMQ
jgi:hypothetical protein